MSAKRRTPDGRALAELARRQHGVVSVRQMVELGHARATIGVWAQDGKLHRIHRGVYAVGHTSLTWEGRCMAAVLANSPAVASHKTAAWIWELRRWRPGRFDLTAPTRRHRREPIVVHFARLAPEDRAVVDGIPVTSVARTVLDLAPDEPTGRLHQMMDRAEERKTFDLRRFDRLLARVGGHPGRVKLRYALDTFKPEQVVLRSDLERRFRDLVLAAGLQTPRLDSAYEQSDALRLFALARSHACDLGAGVGGDPGRTSRCCEGRVTPDVRYATRGKIAHLERRRRAIGPRRSVA